MKSDRDKNKFKAVLSDRHTEIAEQLQNKQRFEIFIKSQKQDYDLNGDRKQIFTEHNKNTLIKYFKLVCGSYGISLGSLLMDNKINDKSKASNLTKKLNYFLEDYSREIGIDSKHPIQVFSYHQTSMKPEEVYWHLACAKTGIHMINRKYSYDNISIDEAKKQSILNAQVAFQETKQQQTPSFLSPPNNTMSKETDSYYAEKTYLKYRADESPLLYSNELVSYLEDRHNCEVMNFGSEKLPVTVLWQNKDKLIHPDEVLGKFDYTDPVPFSDLPTLNPTEYKEAREYIRSQFQVPPNPVRYEGNCYRMVDIDISSDIPKINTAIPQ